MVKDKDAGTSYGAAPHSWITGLLLHGTPGKKDHVDGRDSETAQGRL